MFDYPNNGCFLDYFSMQLVLYMRTRYYMCARVNISRIARDITILFVEMGTEGRVRWWEGDKNCGWENVRIFELVSYLFNTRYIYSREIFYSLRGTILHAVEMLLFFLK